MGTSKEVGQRNHYKVDFEPSDQIQVQVQVDFGPSLSEEKKAIFMTQAFNLLILIFSIIHTGFAKPGKHFLIETDDAAEEDVAKKEDYEIADIGVENRGLQKKEEDCEKTEDCGSGRFCHEEKCLSRWG